MSRHRGRRPTIRSDLYRTVSSVRGVSHGRNDDAAPSPAPDVPFEIGLVMAGAISAGAYTAGVIDFLIQALDEWEKAKEQARKDLADGKSTDCPMHEVRIKVMAGASAGGMTAGLAAGLVGMKFQSVTSLPPTGHRFEPTNNNLYRSWVNTIDIDPLLGASDLAESGRPLQSVLDSSILNQIADQAFVFENADARMARPYIADPLHVFLTVTNLRGVPYPVNFSNFRKQQQYEMMMHGDHMHFMLGRDAARGGRRRHSGWSPTVSPIRRAGASCNRRRWPRGPSRSAWLLACCRVLPSQYGNREWPVPGPKTVDGRTYLRVVREGRPRLVQGIRGRSEVALRVPLRRRRRDEQRAARPRPPGAGGALRSSPREGDKAVRAVLMVMPFPNAEPFNTAYDPDESILPVLFSTFNGLIAQARFKPSELVLADDPNVYSRYLIVPRRGFENGEAPALHHRLRLAGRLRRVPLAEVPRARLPARPAQLPVVPQAILRAPLRGREAKQAVRPLVKGGEREAQDSPRRAWPIPRTRPRSNNER